MKRWAILATIFFSFLLLASFAWAEDKNLDLIKSAARGEQDKVEAALAGGAPVNAQDKYGKTALHEAARNGHLEIVKLLTARGADVKAADKYGTTPLMYAAGGGHAAVVQILLDQGASLETSDQDGESALFYAAKKGQAQTGLLLISKGAKVNDQNKDGSTPLILAAEKGHNAIVKALLAQGADVNAKNKKNLSALQSANQKGHADTAQLLKQAGANGGFTAMEWQGPLCEQKEPAERIIANQQDWQALWKKIFGASRGVNVPEVDFNTCVVACVFLGEKDTGGFSAQFAAPEIKAARMVVPYRELKPAKHAVTARTQPYLMKVFEKKGAAEVVLEKRQ